MPKSEREETITALTARIFRAMIDDLAMDAALQSFQEISRTRAVCNTCHTRCRAVHVPGSSATAVASSRADTPSSTDAAAKISGTEVETGTPPTGSANGSAKADGTTHLECVNCNRQIAPSRYANHLSGCMGFPTTRRGAVRASTNAKAKQNSETQRSDSPASEAGTVSDDKPAARGKGKLKSKAKDETDFNLKRKRLGSPQVSPNKKAKKGRPPGSGSPVSRVLADADISVPPPATHFSPSNSQSKIPSKLRESSTTSQLERSATPGSSRSSSPDGTTPASSAFSRSPNIAARAVGNGKGARGRAQGVGPPKPPSPPPIHVPDFSMVEGGDETGSSTDTDSG